MANHEGDTWKATCHNAWQRHACVTHGMPCVNMHGNLEGYIWGVPIQVVGSRKLQFVGAARRRRRKGKEKGRKGEEKGRKGKEKGRKRKEKERRKKKKKRGGREEKEKGKGRSVAQ